MKSSLAFWKAIKVLNNMQERIKISKILSNVHSLSKVILPNLVSIVPHFTSQGTPTSYQLF